MNDPVRDEELSALLDERDDTLEPARAAELRERVRRDPALAARLDALRALDAELRALPEPEVPAHWLARVKERAQAEALEGEATPGPSPDARREAPGGARPSATRRPPHRRRRLRGILWAAAAAGVAALAAVWLGRPGPDTAGEPSAVARSAPPPGFPAPERPEPDATRGAPGSVAPGSVAPGSEGAAPVPPAGERTPPALAERTVPVPTEPTSPVPAERAAPVPTERPAPAPTERGPEAPATRLAEQPSAPAATPGTAEGVTPDRVDLEEVPAEEIALVRAFASLRARDLELVEELDLMERWERSGASQGRSEGGS